MIYNLTGFTWQSYWSLTKYLNGSTSLPQNSLQLTMRKHYIADNRQNLTTLTRSWAGISCQYTHTHTHLAFVELSQYRLNCWGWADADKLCKASLPVVFVPYCLLDHYKQATLTAPDYLTVLSCHLNTIFLTRFSPALFVAAINPEQRFSFLFLFLWKMQKLIFFNCIFLKSFIHKLWSLTIDN